MKDTKIRPDRKDMPVKAGFGLLLFIVAGFTAVNLVCFKRNYDRRLNTSRGNVPGCDRAV